MKLSEKVAYLKGLEEGLNLDSGKSESKLIKGILEAFDEIVNAIDQNAADLKEMTDRVDEIDMDLGDLEAILFEGFEVEELTEDEFDELGADEDEAFEVYTTDEAPAEEAPAEEEAADELFAEAPAEEVVEEVVEEAPVEEVEEVVEREAEPEEDTYEVECPSCGHVMFIDDSILAQGGIECPKCHEKLEFEVEYED